MDTIEAYFSDGEWDCFARMLFTTEEHDHVPQFLGQSSVQYGNDDGKNIGLQSMFCPTNESEGCESMFYSFDPHNNSTLQNIYQESSDHNVLANNAYTSQGFPMMDEKNHDSMVPLVTDVVIEDNASLNNNEREEPIVFSTKQFQLKRKPDVSELEVHVEEKINVNSSRNQNKKSSASKDVPRCTKNERSRKKQKVEKKEKVVEEMNAGSDGQSCSSYTSEEDHEGVTNAKTRASRGSATDPQSLYARKRRERINSRLRILQNLVPNGTKVDISTMLEEAIHYVKLLQLQIKLLSSDDLWMYAPIAYNGFDIGLDLNRKVSLPE